MPKFITDLHIDQFFSAASKTAVSSDRVLASIAFPLSIVSGLLLIDGVLSPSLASGAIGILGLVAAQAVKNRGE
jgi:predicted anti-sigma-YlaC factor YlaD